MQAKGGRVLSSLLRVRLCRAVATAILAAPLILMAMLGISFLLLGFSNWTEAVQESLVYGVPMLLAATFVLCFAMDVSQRRTYWQWIWPIVIIGPHLAFLNAVLVQMTVGGAYAFFIASQMGFEQNQAAFVYLMALVVMVPASLLSGLLVRTLWGVACRIWPSPKQSGATA